jgi:oxaloacetate decarboxylase alpha subunit
MKVRLVAEVDGKPALIDIDADHPLGLIRVAVDDREYVLDVAQPSPGLYSLLLDGRVLNAYVALRRGKREVRLGGWTASVDIAPARGRRPATAAVGVGGRQEIAAPMSGRVVQVLVHRGQHVQEGESLVIIEAMKMETEIRSPIRGQVKDVQVQAGMAVETGQLLLVVEGS